MTDQPTREADLGPRPGAEALESSLDRTQRLLQEFREEMARLMAKVDQDVERLREAALGGAGAAPGIASAGEEEAAAAQRLAEIVGAEQSTLRTRALVNELIDKRFEELTALIQAQRARGRGDTPSRRRS